MERNDSADSVSMPSATISGKYTMIAGEDVRQDFLADDAQVGDAHADGGLDELAFLEREHLTAQRPGDIRNVDERDDEDRHQQAARADLDRAQMDSAGQQDHRQRDGKQVDRERPHKVE